MTKEKLFLVAENNFDKLNAFNWKKEEKKANIFFFMLTNINIYLCVIIKILVRLSEFSKRL